MLLSIFHSLLQNGWKNTFARESTLSRAIEQAQATIATFGKRMIARMICTLGRQDQDWSADYKIFSRSPWDEDSLFDPILDHYLQRYPDGPLTLPLDDTILKKTGLKIETTRWLRDPLSPPFRVNLIRGLRFVQTTLIFPLYQEGNHSSRSFPVGFREAPPLRKPGKRAREEERQHYKEAQKQHTLSLKALEIIRNVRARLDAKGARNRGLIVVVDGSYCNRTMFRADLERVELVARCRKDARLCFPAPGDSRRKYAVETFTPEQVRQDDSIPWKEARVYYGGRWRQVRVKEGKSVLWRRGALIRSLRLIVMAPQPYRPSPLSKTLYREPAYLLSTDLTSEIHTLAQAFLDRWQIECNHRDEKEIMGVGEAQVRSPQSVARQPAFTVAVYSLLMLAGLLAFGPERTNDYLPLPKWRKKKTRRASILDLIAVMRKEINETSDSCSQDSEIYKNMAKNAPLYAYT